MDEEQAALTRIRVLRAASYRCGYRAYADSAMCGRYASHVGMQSVDERLVALCLEHALL